MFDLFDPGKLLIVAIVALLVIGPKDLPRVLRTIGQVVGKMRRMAGEFQGQFMDALKEAELDDIKKELKALGDSAKIDASFDPTTIMRDEVTASIEGRGGSSASTVDISTPTASEAPAPQVLTHETPLPDAAEPVPENSDAPLARGRQG
jgi:sec-independent protein translocase protein TatB